VKGLEMPTTIVSINYNKKTFHTTGFVFEGEKGIEFLELQALLGCDDFTDVITTGKHVNTLEKLVSNGFKETFPFEKFSIQAFHNGTVLAIPLEFVEMMYGQDVYRIIKQLREMTNTILVHFEAHAIVKYLFQDIWDGKVESEANRERFSGETRKFTATVVNDFVIVAFDD
jgi:hypothetical protein